MTRRLRAGAILPLLLITSLLTACGFQLRGQADIASELQQLSVSGNEHLFIRDLRRALTATGIEITDSAPYKLELVRLEQETGTASQAGAGSYERLLTVKATYQLKTSDGLNLFPELQQGNERFVYQNKNQVNAALSEESIVFEELRKNLISTTVLRVAGISNDALLAEVDRARKVRQAELEALEPQQ